MTDEIKPEDVKLPEPKFHEDHGPHGNHFTYFTADQVRAAVLEATMAERERCAKLAAAFATCGCNGAHGRCTEDDVPLAIVSAIRSGHSITETKRAEE